MSKLMTIYLVLESIERGEMSWHDEVLINETANDLGHGAVSMPVTAGDTLIVQDLFHAMVISSANNATIALAEHVAGTERALAQLMNETAADLELSQAT